jgi:hypothetical protein
MPVIGIPVDGIPVIGIPVDGVPVIGIPVDGVPVDGVPVDGVPVVWVVVDENENSPPIPVPVIAALKFWKLRPGMPPSIGAGATATVPE